MTRSGASPGDLVVVSGRPGAAAHALAMLQSGRTPDDVDLAALEYPVPRLRLGRALRGLATSCIDISDGLLADLGHVLEASATGAELELQSLPCPHSMSSMPARERWPLQLSGGDDYELCFTLPAAFRDRLPELSRIGQIELTVYRRAVTGQAGLVVREPGGGLYQAAQAGVRTLSRFWRARAVKRLIMQDADMRRVALRTPAGFLAFGLGRRTFALCARDGGHPWLCGPFRSAPETTSSKPVLARRGGPVPRGCLPVRSSQPDARPARPREHRLGRNGRATGSPWRSCR